VVLLDPGERLTYAILRCVCGGQIEGHRGARVRGKPTGDLSSEAPINAARALD
jgi:hypothetical protein